MQSRNDMLARLRSTIAGWKAEVGAAHAGLTQQIAASSGQLAHMVDTLDRHAEQALQVAAAQDEVQQLRRALDAAALPPGALTQYTVDRGSLLENIRQEWRDHHQRLQSSIVTWTREVAEAQRGLSQQIAQAAAQFDALIGVLDRGAAASSGSAGLDAPEDTIEALRRENTSLSDHISALARELTDLRQQRSASPAPPEDETIRLLQNEAAMFRDVLADRDETLEAARAAMQRLQAERDALAEQLQASATPDEMAPAGQADALRLQRDALQGTLQHLESQLSILQERESAGLARVQALLQEIETQRDLQPATAEATPPDSTQLDAARAERDAAQAELASLRELVATRDAQLETQKLRFAEFERHSAALRAQLESIFDDSNNATEQAQAFANALMEREQRIEDLQEGLQVAQQALAAADQREATWAEQRRQWEAAINDARDAGRAGIAAVQQEVDAARARIDYMETSLGEAQQRVAALGQQLEEAQDALSVAHAELNSQAEAIHAAEDRAQSAEAQSTALEEARQAECIARESLEAARAQLEAEVADARAVAEQAESASEDSRAALRDLNETLQTALNWVNDTEARNADLQSELASVQAREAALQENLRQFSAEIEELRKAEFSRAEVLARERSEMATLRVTLSEREAEIRTLRQQLAERDTSLATARAEATDVSTRHADLATQLETLKAERMEQTAWADVARERLAELETALGALTTEKDALSSGIAETEARATEAEREKARLAEALAQVQAEAAEQQAKLESVSAHLLAREDELLQLSAEATRLAGALQAAQAEEARAQADLTGLRDQLGALRVERETQEVRIREAQDLLRENESKLIRTSEENDGLATRLTELLPRHEAAEAERQQLAAHLDALKAESDAQATEVQRAQDRLRMHERALEQLSAERETLEQTLREAQEREARDREEQERVAAQLESLRAVRAEQQAWVDAAEARLAEQEATLEAALAEKTWLAHALEETQQREQGAQRDKRELAGELAALRAAHAELEPQFEAARRRLQEQESALGRIMTEMDEITRTLAVAQRREADALRERDEAAAQIVQLRQERDAEAVALFEAHRRLETQEADLERLDADRAAMAAESEAARARETDARAERDRLVDELAGLQQRQGTDAESIAAAAARLALQEQTLQETVAENERLAAQLADVAERDRVARADRDRLHDALMALEAEKASVVERLDAVESALAKRQEDLAQRETDIVALSQTLDEMAQALETLRTQEAEARSAADALRTQLDVVQAEALPAVEALAETQQTVAALQQALKSREAAAADLAARSEALEVELARLQEEEAARRDESERAAAALLEELQTTLQAQQSDLAQRDDMIAELRDALGALEAELSEQRGLQATDNGQLRELMQRLNEAVQERDQAMAAVEDLKDTRRRLLLGATGGRGHAAQRGIEAQRRDILVAQAIAPEERSALGEMLVQAGLITAQQLKDALKLQRKSPGQLLGTILMQEEWTTEDAIAQAVACQLDLPLVDITPNACEPDAVRLLDRDICTWHVCVPVRVSAKRLVVAMANPLDEAAIQKMQEKSRREIRPVVATGSTILGAIESLYGSY